MSHSDIHFEKQLDILKLELLTFVDTKEASKITGIPAATLTTLRCRGGGPPFFQPHGTRFVRYSVYHLVQWMTEGGVKSSTEDPGTPISFFDTNQPPDSCHQSQHQVSAARKPPQSQSVKPFQERHASSSPDNSAQSPARQRT